MSLIGIKALTFDTGGTILDWHSGFRNAFEAAGSRHGIKRDWATLANDLRRQSLEAMLNLGAKGDGMQTIVGGTNKLKGITGECSYSIKYLDASTTVSNNTCDYKM